MFVCPVSFIEIWIVNWDELVKIPWEGERVDQTSICIQLKIVDLESWLYIPCSVADIDLI